MAQSLDASPVESAKRFLCRAAVSCVAVLSPAIAMGEPVQLKLSYIGSEQAQAYQAGIKPFVEAVNAEGKGLVNIVVYADGALGKSVPEQPAMLQKEIADIAWVIPGQTPYRFPDNELFEFPGLVQDFREGTLAYTHLVAADRLRGYQPFFVIGTYVTSPAFIHSSKPVPSIAALRGQKVRVNNATEAAALERLGMIPTVMPVSQVAAAIERGTVDSAVIALTGLHDYGIGRFATYHYYLVVGVAPVALLMNRKKFESLPDAAKDLIRKYSGEWTAARWIEALSAIDQRNTAALGSDPRHVVVIPSPADREVADRRFRTLIEDWAATGTRNRDLLERLEAELSTIRSGAR